MPHHGGHRLIDTQQLMVAGHHLAHSASLAAVEQNEVLHNIQQTVFGQHAVQQHLGRHAARICFVQTLPLAKVLPGAGDRAEACVVSVADNQKRVVVKRMGDDVFVQVVPQIAIKARADVFVHRLQFDEHQWQAVDEAHQISPAVVVGRAQPGELELAHHQKTVVIRVAKVDHRSLCMAKLPLGTAITHRHPVADQLVKRLVVLQQRTGKIVVRQLADRLFNGARWQKWVEFGQRRPQVTYQHHVTFTGTAQRTGGTEGFLVPGVNAVPTENFFQMLRKGGLYQTVFAVDVGVGHALLAHLLAWIWLIWHVRKTENTRKNNDLAMHGPAIWLSATNNWARLDAI